MDLKALRLTVMAAAAAALVAACGGGGGSSTPAETPSIQLNGVAATGLALANSSVSVKCAAGTGTATTNDAGSFTVSVPDGQMPCIVQVTGTANGVPVTLHSLAEGSGTTATVNVTPLTELILARAAGTVPAALFADFSAGTAPTGTALSAATTEVLTALGTAAGVDMSGVNPFTGTLVAATPSNPTGGNTYDQLLDQLGTVVSPAMLSQVVSQVASTTGSSAPVTLDQVVANLQAGSLPGCPQALSGKYNVVDYDGVHQVVELNFATMLVNGNDQIKMVRNESQKCEVTVNDTMDNVVTTVVFGPTGAGVTRDDRILGYIFPVQSHSLDSIVGRKWDFVESGIEAAGPKHWVGEMTIAADKTVSVCEYEELDFSSCAVDTSEAVSVSQSGSQLYLNYPGSSSPIFGFRAPNGTLTLFGSNVEGDLGTSFIMTQPQPVPVQSVGTSIAFWNVIQRFATEPVTDPVSTGSLTITAATADSVTRTFADGRTDTWLLNKPIQGLRKLESSPTYQRILPGLGVTIGIDGSPAQVLRVSVNRPAE